MYVCSGGSALYDGHVMYVCMLCVYAMTVCVDVMHVIYVRYG